VGIDAFMKKTDGGLSFADLLQPYMPGTEVVPPDAAQVGADELAESVRRRISGIALTARVSPPAAGELFDVALVAEGVPPEPLPAGVEVHAWPITLAEHTAAAVSSTTSPLATYHGLSFAGLTSFFAFRVTARSEGRSACLRFVLNVPLVGAPPDRKDRILKSLLSTPEQVLKFLMFLLSEFGTEGGALEVGEALNTGSSSIQWGSGGSPLFESLMKALDQSPGRLDQVAKLVDDLRAAGDNLLPAGFDEVWLPVWEARNKGNP